MTRYHPCPERTAWRRETVRGGWYTLQRLWRLRRWHWFDRVAVILTAPVRVVGNLVIGPPTPMRPTADDRAIQQEALMSDQLRHTNYTNMVNLLVRDQQLRQQLCDLRAAAQSKAADEFLADGGKPGVFSSRKTEP